MAALSVAGLIFFQIECPYRTIAHGRERLHAVSLAEVGQILFRVEGDVYRLGPGDRDTRLNHQNGVGRSIDDAVEIQLRSKNGSVSCKALVNGVTFLFDFDPGEW